MHRKSIRQLQQEQDKGLLSSKELCKYYLQRILDIDQCNKGYNSVAEINPEVLDIAEQLDRERMSGQVRGQMHGIPVLLKDNINTSDMLHTTAGSLALKDNFAPNDADIVKNLRKAGAIILGKTNMTEFANFMTKGMRSGYSSRGGNVLYPYDKSKDPSGSSTGSAVAIVMNLCTTAIGTETNGSILCPARTNGIVGMKPTHGLLSIDGILPISSTLDTAGPMTACVEDSAILLEAMSGNKYSKNLIGEYNKNLRIGVNRAHEDIMDEQRLKHLNTFIKSLKSMGFTVIDDISEPYRKELWDIMINEFKNSINHYLSTMGTNSKMKTLDDIIEFNKENNKNALKYGQKYLLSAKYDTSGRMIEPKYLKALIQRDSMIRKMERLMDEKELDMILYSNEFNNLPAFTGFPSITIPIGIDVNGVPTGIHLMAKRFYDKALLKTAFKIEQFLDVKIPYPKM